VTYDHVTIYWLPSNGAIIQCGRKAHAVKVGRTSRVQHPHGTYIMTSHPRKNTITITDLISQIPSQFIDTGAMISGLALTGNILLVVDSEMVVAWRLTEQGVVDGVFGNRWASHSDSIWTISPMLGTISPEFSLVGQVGFIALNNCFIYTPTTRELGGG